MRRTIADQLEEKGVIKKSRETLLRLLKRRSGSSADPEPAARTTTQTAVTR